MGAPLVSVIAPAHNAVQFFDTWIASIEGQHYEPLEVVLVDDGCTDGIAERASSGPAWLRYVRQEQRGPAAARNTGIRASSGELIAFLDLDDLWTPSHLRRAVQTLEQHPEAGIAQGLIRNVLSGVDGRLCYSSRAYRFLNLGAAVFRRQVFDDCGLFDETLQFAEDFDLITRCWERGVRKLNIDEVSLLYRRHDSNMTKGKSREELGAIRVFKLHLDRVKAGLAPENARETWQVGFAQYIGRTVPPHGGSLHEPVEGSEP